MVVADTSANASSKEENNIKKFTQQEKDGTFSQRGTKTFYDTLNTVIRMAQKRAKVALARQFFAITGEFDGDDENPKANKRTQQSIYTLFYKLFLGLAPKAPTKKKNLKTNKWKQISLPDQLKHKKEWLRAKYLQPNLLENGLPTYDWGIKDIEKIKEAMPNWYKLAKEGEEKCQKKLA